MRDPFAKYVVTPQSFATFVGVVPQSAGDGFNNLQHWLQPPPAPCAIEWKERGVGWRADHGSEMWSPEFEMRIAKLGHKLHFAADATEVVKDVCEAIQLTQDIDEPSWHWSLEPMCSLRLELCPWTPEHLLLCTDFMRFAGSLWLSAG